MEGWEKYLKESMERWDKNAPFCDDYMGEDSNSFHREIVRPFTEKLLSVKEGDLVLDVACGN